MGSRVSSAISSGSSPATRSARVVRSSTRRNDTRAATQTNCSAPERSSYNRSSGHSPRTVSSGPELTHLTGHTELFFVPFDWLKTAVALDHRTTSSGVDTYRLSPSAAVRFTENLKVGFSIRDVHTDVDSRTYLFELLVKAQ